MWGFYLRHCYACSCGIQLMTLPHDSLSSFLFFFSTGQQCWKASLCQLKRLNPVPSEPSPASSPVFPLLLHCQLFLFPVSHCTVLTHPWRETPLSYWGRKGHCWLRTTASQQEDALLRQLPCCSTDLWAFLLISSLCCSFCACLCVCVCECAQSWVMN